MPDSSTPSPIVRRTIRVTGQVQGVGFRPFVHRLAEELEVSGSVKNDSAGVTIVAVGTLEALDELVLRIGANAPALARVDEVTVADERPAATAPEPVAAFDILESDLATAGRGRVTPDTATCPDCLTEIHAPHNRRHGHAFANCTACGPRYSIVRDLPYDRARTTMAAFAMCPKCAREYGEPEDRRFHAQPVCCPDCGPRLRLIDGQGAPIQGDPVADAARLLTRGAVVAVKGLGGFHLAAAAWRESAVSRLRHVKRRDAKPFAVMVPDLETARRLTRLQRGMEERLTSVEAPIVLSGRRDSEEEIAPSVAPGCGRLGILLPYTPLHHLLLDRVRRPLVMTSANLSEDPLLSEEEDLLALLGSGLDAVLTHDRPIERAVDDSIVLEGAFGPVVLRRARGLVPVPSRLPVAAPEPGLATGGELKSVVAVVRGNEAVESQHIGDLGHALAYRRFETTIEDLLRLYDVEVRWIAADLHPAYASTRYAVRRAKELGVPLVSVQHHHAHLASLLAEHGRTDRILGLVCDGVGYGDDGTAWGGELLAADLISFERIGRVRPLRLPGGDAATREIGRCAVSWLYDAIGEDALRHDATSFVEPDYGRRRTFLGMLTTGMNCPESSGTGRLFDAAAALLGLTDRNLYEAMSGTLLEARALSARRRRPGGGLMALGKGDRLELDHRPLLHRMLEMIGGEETVDEIAWLFHDALADGLANLAIEGADRTGLDTVGLSGGVFANALLTDMLAERLGGAGLRVLVHADVPPNDGGIALGQAAVAAARIAGEGR